MPHVCGAFDGGVKARRPRRRPRGESRGRPPRPPRRPVCGAPGRHDLRSRAPCSSPLADPCSGGRLASRPEQWAVAGGPSSTTARRRSRARRSRATTGSTRPGSMRSCGRPAARRRSGTEAAGGSERLRRCCSRRDDRQLGLPGQEQQCGNDHRDRCEAGERDQDERSAPGVFPAGRCGDDPALGRPGGGERTWVEALRPRSSSAETPSAAASARSDCQVCGHLVGERIGDTKATPLPAALLDELTHEATSTFTGASTASTASRAARHSDTPSASASRPALEGR